METGFDAQGMKRGELIDREQGREELGTEMKGENTPSATKILNLSDTKRLTYTERLQKSSFPLSPFPSPQLV